VVGVEVAVGDGVDLAERHPDRAQGVGDRHRFGWYRSSSSALPNPKPGVEQEQAAASGGRR
jgi:hypothetical protein